MTGAQIRRTRKQLRMTQADLAKKAGISVMSVYSAETGRVKSMSRAKSRIIEVLKTKNQIAPMPAMRLVPQTATSSKPNMVKEILGSNLSDSTKVHLVQRVIS